MNKRDFPSRAEAEIYKDFLNTMTGTAAKVTVNVGHSGTGILGKYWQVNLGYYLFSDKQKDQCSIFLKQRYQERSSYLEAKSKEYLEMTPDALSKLWADNDTLATDEIEYLRVAVRISKDIKPQLNRSSLTCKQCGMVEDNCTCTRSWF
jgi:hypothetical protein